MFTIGVEEEYQIVDAETGVLQPRGSRLLHALPHEVEEYSANELFLAQIEIGIPVCHSLGGVRHEIRRLRRGLIETAQQHGLNIVASSTHPFAVADEQQITPKERYLGMAQDYQQLAREHFICGCHVHVGINDRELAIDVMNRARGWLAPIVALAANSPFWEGDDTGYASFRTEVWRRWPMAGSPQPFASRAEYDALVRVLVETGSISDESKIYWDMRPADRYETLEFRATDVGLTVDDAVLVAGLVQSLAKTCYDEAVRDREQDAMFLPVRPELLRAAEWRAARFGIEDELIDVHAGQKVPAPQLIARLLEYVRPALEESGDWDEISALVEQVQARGNGAMRQRRVFADTNKLQDVVSFLAEQTQSGI